MWGGYALWISKVQKARQILHLFELAMSEAEKKWKAFDNQFGWLAQDSSFKSREAYKAALRREIEKYFNNAIKEPSHQYNGGLIDAYKTVLELLDTVEPWAKKRKQ